MINSIKQRIDRDEEEGFTLIELMVVLLIIAILLAIAIPTFLGARNTANARSTQENLRNALTAEQTNWTSNQVFTSDASSLEPSLTWDTTGPTDLTVEGARSVAAVVGTDTATVTIQGLAKDGNCYAVYQSNDPTADFTAYTAYKAATGPACAALTAPSAAPTAAMSGTIAATPGAAVWYTSW